MCPKINVMERECKKLEFGGDLIKTQIVFLVHVNKDHCIPSACLFVLVLGWTTIQGIVAAFPCPVNGVLSPPDALQRNVGERAKPKHRPWPLTTLVHAKNTGYCCNKHQYQH
jgi:hypothetical protein